MSFRINCRRYVTSILVASLLIVGSSSAEVVLKGKTNTWPNPMGPMPAYQLSVILGNLDFSKPVSGIDQSSLRVNGLVPISIETVDTYPDYTGPVLKLKIRVSNFYKTYTDPFDPFSQEYAITGLWHDGVTQLDAKGQVAFYVINSGDADYDDLVDIADFTMMLDYAFMMGDEPISFKNADMDRDGMIDISDITLMIQYLFLTTY